MIVLNKQPRTGDRESSFSLRAGRGADNLSP
jgi:hypothetical protein